MKIEKMIEGRKVIFNAPESPAKPAPVASQTYSALPVKPPMLKTIRRKLSALLGFKETKQSGKERCVGCGQTILLEPNTHQFYRGDRPICARCAGTDGAQLAQCYAMVMRDPRQQYTMPSGSVSAVK